MKDDEPSFSFSTIFSDSYYNTLITLRINQKELRINFHSLLSTK